MTIVCETLCLLTYFVWILGFINCNTNALQSLSQLHGKFIIYLLVKSIVLIIISNIIEITNGKIQLIRVNTKSHMYTHI